MPETPTPVTRPSPARDEVPPTHVDLDHLYVESWPRSYVQYPYEAAVLERLAGGDLSGTHVLETGCGGSGVGLRLAVHRWGAREVLGIDRSADHVASARRRTRDLADAVRVQVGDAEHLDDLPDGGFDVVASYHCLHHLADWRQGLREAARVLRPGGHFLFAELSRRALDNRLLRAVAYHPPGRFTEADLLDGLQEAGLSLQGDLVRKAHGWWVLGAARRDG